MKNQAYQILKNPIVIKFIYGLIVLNVIALVFESYKEIRIPYQSFFDAFEAFSVMVFTIEYIFRLWTADKYEEGKLKFICSPLGIIDLIAVLPFYLPMIFPFDLRIIRILRLFRLLRILKLGRFSKSLQAIYHVLRDTRSELSITLFVALILLVLSSTLMFYMESDAQPDKFPSIVHAFWWSVATLTTVGYGDVYPVTAAGKILSAIIALIGIGFVALPTGIISSAFIEKLQERNKKKSELECKCPNCGTIFNTERERS